MSSAFLNNFALVKPAEIEWRDDLPFSLDFNDVYFSDAGGLAETQHVFIQGSQLAEKWQSSSQSHFSIAELGFGTGLNFMATAQHWQQQRQLNPALNNQQLNYISIEKRPLSSSDFKRASDFWPELSDYAQTILANYPSPTYGRHSISFAQLNLQLTLIYMPVELALADLINESQLQQNKIQFDHWYLDGFAPDKNSDMWNNALCQQIAQLSRTGSRIATYSVAGAVKNPLLQNGFELKKIKGFARKREMLTGVFKQPSIQGSKFNQRINLKTDRPWFAISRSIPSKKVAIIGAGIAGCTTSWQFAQKGWAVDLYDESSLVAAKASGAAAGIFHPQITSDFNYTSQFNWQAYLYLLNFLGQLSSAQLSEITISQGVNRVLPDIVSKTELLHLAQSLHLQTWIQPSSDFADNERAIYFPHAAAIDLQKFCRLLLSLPSQAEIKLNLNTHINNITALSNSAGDQQWQLATANDSQTYQHVIFCGGANSQLMNSLMPFTTNTSRGQTTQLHSQQIDQRIQKVLCEKSYLVPNADNYWMIGGTFDDFEDDELRSTSQQQLLNNTASLLSDLQLKCYSPQQSSEFPLAGTVGYRLHSSDRLPIVGGAIAQQRLITDFAQIGNKSLCKSDLSHYNTPGLWLNTGYGSHGLLYSLLASEHLFSLIDNTVSPLHQRLAQAIHPARFSIKKLKNESKKTR